MDMMCGSTGWAAFMRGMYVSSKRECSTAQRQINFDSGKMRETAPPDLYPLRSPLPRWGEMQTYVANCEAFNPIHLVQPVRRMRLCTAIRVDRVPSSRACLG